MRRLGQGENLELRDAPVAKDVKPKEEERQKTKANEVPSEDGDEDDSLKRLQALTDTDLKHWREILMPGVRKACSLPIWL